MLGVPIYTCSHVFFLPLSLLSLSLLPSSLSLSLFLSPALSNFAFISHAQKTELRVCLRCTRYQTARFFCTMNVRCLNVHTLTCTLACSLSLSRSYSLSLSLSISVFHWNTVHTLTRARSVSLSLSLYYFLSSSLYLSLFLSLALSNSVLLSHTHMHIHARTHALTPPDLCILDPQRFRLQSESERARGFRLQSESERARARNSTRGQERKREREKERDRETHIDSHRDPIGICIEKILCLSLPLFLNLLSLAHTRKHTHTQSPGHLCDTPQSHV